MKLRTKMILAFSFISILSVVVIGFAGITIGQETMEREAYEKLTAIRELKANHIESYFDEIRKQIISYAEDIMVVDATNELQKAFHGVSSSEIGIEADEVDQNLREFYQNTYLPRLDSNSPDTPALNQYYPTDHQTRTLQYIYVAGDDGSSDAKSQTRKSEYGRVHDKYHNIFEKFTQRFGYYDLFIIDTSGHIVYTVSKEIDFATSIRTGAFASSSLSAVAEEVLTRGTPGTARMMDFAVYAPSYNEYASFIAAPIYRGDKKIGALCFQLPIERFNNIMTDNQRWESIGLGNSGETYIVGSDSTLRNQSRFLIEDKDAYLAKLKESGVDDHTILQISTLNNSIGLQRVASVGVQRALSGQSGTEIFDDYRGVPVLSSYKPLQIPDVQWAILSELDKEEAFADVDDFIQRLLIWSIILVLVIPIVALLFTHGLTKPLIRLMYVSEEIAAGHLDVKTGGLKRKDVIGALSRSIEAMRTSIRKVLSDLQDANDTLEEKVKDRTQEVHDANEDIRLIVENANDAIITVDPQQTILRFNPAACEMFGYEENEIIGQSLLTILPKSAHESHHGLMKKFAGSPIMAKRMDQRPDVSARRKDGSLFPIEASISKQMVGDRLHFTAFIKDITERRLLEQRLEDANQRMEEELNVGKEIQLSMLPLIFPAFPEHSEFNVHALLESAREVGGDFYDFYFIDKHRFLFTIADVSGKGVPSALFMAVSKTLIKSRANEDDSPASIITFVNDELSRENKTSMFVTLFICVIDLSTGVVRYTNAGHNPPYLKRVNGEIETLSELHGPAVGAVEDYVYREGSVKLRANDRLILFTDGVNESMNPNRDQYGNQRIIESLKSSSGSVRDMLEDLRASVKEFEDGAEQADDITVLGFEYLEPIVINVIESKVVTLNSELTEIDRLNDEFNSLCESHNIPSASYLKFNIVFDELINNIVSYGYENRSHHEIRVKIDIIPDLIVVHIEDDGIAFNPLKAATPDTSASIEEREIGGLGIHIVRELMDNVSYKRYTKKNLTTLYKKYTAT